MNCRNIVLFIATTFILSACSTSFYQSSDRDSTQYPLGVVTPSNIYDSCMRVEMKMAMEKKIKDPKIYAHMICSIYANACKDSPEGENCQKGILLYSETFEPLNNLVGNWGITTFVFGGGHHGDSTCGLFHRPVTIGPVADNKVSLSVLCSDGSEHIFELRRDTDAQNYLISVKSKEGISVVNFPVEYAEGKGWTGSNLQAIEGNEISITATVMPIEGQNWNGWTITVSRTEDVNRDIKDVKTPFLKFDLTRRK